MMRILKVATLAGLLVVATPSVAFGKTAPPQAFETDLGPAVRVAGDPRAGWSLQERMVHYRVPGAAVGIIRDGRLVWAKGYGVLQAGGKARVDADTLFSVASVSKLATAAALLTQVQQGRINLDRPVNDYLKRWTIPANAFTAIHPVTLRCLMSHTAGLNLDNFPDFQPDVPLPTLLDTLEGRQPSTLGAVRVQFTPGSASRYSGGGTMVEQLLLEEVTGQPFVQATHDTLFAPLHMSRSTFENPLPAAWGNIAHAHDSEGRPRALPRGWESMPEMAPSGLWTSAKDLSQLVIALLDSYRGRGNGFIELGLARAMMTEVGPSPVGLGAFLDGRGFARRFSHYGSNDSYKAWIEGHLATGNGLVIITNSASGGDLIDEIRHAVADNEGWASGGSSLVPKVEFAASELEHLAGTYAIIPPRGLIEQRLALLPPPASFTIQVVDGRLSIAPGGRPGLGKALIAEDPAHFVLEQDNTRRVEFVYDATGEVAGLIYREGDYVAEAERVSQSR